MGSLDRVALLPPAAPPARRRIGALATAGLRCGAVAAALLTALVPGLATAQAPPPPGYASPPPGGTAAIYSPAQLDQMLAPVALYPDDLLGQMLMAATYPLEVVQANRWLQNPGSASLRGDALAQALQSMPWDSSVKSLCAYPQILAWMDSALDWTEAVGDAFLAQQADVMDSVQRLRGRAQAAGTLSSTPQQTVVGSDGDIQITSPDSSMEYVPVYSPDVAYGPWPYSDYPPYDLMMPGYAVGTFISFPILFPFWGWNHWDWHHHRIDIDNGVGGPGGRRVPMRPVPWQHDPAHRGGIPYRDPGTRQRFLGSVDTHRDYRGYYPNRPAPGTSTAPAMHARPPAGADRPPIAQRPAPVAPRPPVVDRTPPPSPAPRPPVVERSAPAPMPEVRRPVPAPRPVPQAIERPMAPAMESFGRGAEVHAQEMRGAASRAAPPSSPVGAIRGGRR